MVFNFFFSAAAGIALGVAVVALPVYYVYLRLFSTRVARRER